MNLQIKQFITQIIKRNLKHNKKYNQLNNINQDKINTNQYKNNIFRSNKK